MQSNGRPLPEGAPSGRVEGSTLWNAVTLSGVNRYTGAVAVRHEWRTGTLGFVEGRLVHAESGETTGEAAFQRIMRWPASSFTLRPEEVPKRASISRGLALLLVDLKGLPTRVEPAHQPSTPTPAPTATPAAAPASPAPARLEWLSAATERIRAEPGVLGATLLGKDGPVGALAARTPEDQEAMALGRASERLGSALGLGRLVLGVARGEERLVLILTTREHQITVLIRADQHADAVQARIRSHLIPQS